MGKKVLMQGNEACVMGAIAAGMRFFAGYPITPSTEIAEISAQELPKVGGRFLQMEDEISGAAAALGATLHWFDEIDGEAYAGRESVAKLAALPEATF